MSKFGVFPRFIPPGTSCVLTCPRAELLPCCVQYEDEYREFRLHSIMAEHKKTITAIAWNPSDGDLLASTSADNQVRRGPGGEGRGAAPARCRESREGGGGAVLARYGLYPEVGVFRRRCVILRHPVPVSVARRASLTLPSHNTAFSSRKTTEGSLVPHQGFLTFS